MHHHRWIQKLGIILALLLIMLAFPATVQQQRGLKMRPHRVQQPEHTLPRLPEVYRMPIMDTSVYAVVELYSQMSSYAQNNRTFILLLLS